MEFSLSIYHPPPLWYYTPTFKGGLGLKTLHQATHLMRLRQLQNLIKTEDSSTMNNSHTHHYIPGLDNLKHALPIWITSWKDLLFVHPTSNKPWSEIKWHKITKWWQSILFETPKKALLQMVDPLPDKSWPIWNNRYLMHNNQAIMKTTNAKNKSMIYYWASNGITHLRHVYILNTISTAAQLLAKINNAPPPEGISLNRLLQYTTTILSKIHSSTIQYRNNNTTQDWNIPLYDKDGNPQFLPIKAITKSQMPRNIPPPPHRTTLLSKAASALNIPAYPINNEYWPKEAKHKSNLLPFYHDIIWRLQRNGLPTGHKYKWSVEINSLCKSPCPTDETPEHLFWTCPLASYTWTKLSEPYDTILPLHSNGTMPFDYTTYHTQLIYHPTPKNL